MGQRNVLLKQVTEKVYSELPSPGADLILGVSLGIDTLKSNPRFNDVMLGVGLIHVVVVSGYNINLVFNFVTKLWGSKLSSSSLFAAQISALLYSFIVGFSPPVTRAVISTSINYWCKYYGYRSNPLYILLFTVIVMVLANVAYLEDLSFQLSVLSSAGIIMFADKFYTYIRQVKLPEFFKTDFVSSLAAQLFTLPLIYFVFGRFTLLGLLANPFVLWIIPILTSLSLVYIFLSFTPLYIPALSQFLLLLATLFVNLSKYFHSLFNEIV